MKIAIAPQPELTAPGQYRPLTAAAVTDYLAEHRDIAARLGGRPVDWGAREVGDGNLNLVFIVEGTESKVVVKQALPYVRMVGEGWPLPLSRTHFEHLALVEQARYARQYVPAVYLHDEPMALTVMECLSPHVTMREGLIRGVTYTHVAWHVGEFLALTLYHTSDLHLRAAEKKVRIAQFLTNTAMCRISEDLIFDEPYFAAPMNRHTSPQLDDIAGSFRTDTVLKLAVQEMKWRFHNSPEALIHGDLHTGSIMTTERDTRAIDPEFAFYGPMGFDVGVMLGNLLMAYFAQGDTDPGRNARAAYAAQILEHAATLWNVFAERFTDLWRGRTCGNSGGDVYQQRLYEDAPALLGMAIDKRLAEIWRDTVGFTGCEMIRRILGLAHVEDFEGIANPDVRAARERKALELARSLLVGSKQLGTIDELVSAARAGW
jgi:5-methylthioribose kinase